MVDPADYLKTADVWTVLDLIVAEWTSDPTSVQCFDSRLRERAAVLVDARRKARAAGGDPGFVELADALMAWLATKGWRVLVVGDPAVRQNVSAETIDGPVERVGHFMFTVNFTGGKTRATPASPILLPGNGETH